MDTLETLEIINTLNYAIDFIGSNEISDNLEIIVEHLENGGDIEGIK